MAARTGCVVISKCAKKNSPPRLMTRQKVERSVARSGFVGCRRIVFGRLAAHVNPTLPLPTLGEGILISPPRRGEIQRGLISVLCATARNGLLDRLFAAPSFLTRFLVVMWVWVEYVEKPIDKEIESV